MMKCVLGDESGVVTGFFPYKKGIQAEKIYFLKNY